MADRLTIKERSWNMSRIRATNTLPELAIRKKLFAEGYRYRVNYKIEGKPDITFPKQKIAVFIHGCFWHQHGCKDTYRPKTNKSFWNNKLDRNMERDIEVKRKLEEQGWKVVYVWECEINNSNRAINRIINYLK